MLGCKRLTGKPLDLQDLTSEARLWKQQGYLRAVATRILKLEKVMKETPFLKLCHFLQVTQLSLASSSGEKWD